MASLTVEEREKARKTFDSDVDRLSDRALAEAIVLVCDGVDFAANALRRNGIEPTADAAAAIAVEVARVYEGRRREPPDLD